VASIRQSRLNRSPTANVRMMPAFKANCAGPVMLFRPAFPHWPSAGGANAVGFAYEPAGIASLGSLSSGRSVPVTPVPVTGAKYTGVRGSPLPAVRWPVRGPPLGRLRGDPFHPSASVLAPRPTPVEY